MPSSHPTDSDHAILLVEDNPNDEALALRALSKAGFVEQVTVVRDGVQALEYLLGNGETGAQPNRVPRVVLLDLKLPKVDGLEVLRRLRQDERTRLLPVVVFTSSDEQRDRLEAYQLLANSYVRKPVQFDEFSDTVQRLAHYWARLNQPAE